MLTFNFDTNILDIENNYSGSRWQTNSNKKYEGRGSALGINFYNDDPEAEELDESGADMVTKEIWNR